MSTEIRVPDIGDFKEIEIMLRKLQKQISSLINKIG